jgi:hypothetical protein
VCAGCDRLGNYSRVFGELLCTERHEWGDHARLIQGVGFRVKFSSQIIREARFVKEFAPRLLVGRFGVEGFISRPSGASRLARRRGLQ